MVARPCRRRRPSSLDDGGISWFFLKCGATCVVSLQLNGELREPLFWPQGSPVSIRVARGCTALLSRHGRGIGPQDAFKGESRGLSRVAARNPGFPRLVTVNSRASQGAYGKSGILWTWEEPLRAPLGLVQWKRASSRVEAGTSGFLSCSDVDLGLCMPFQTGSQVSTCVEAWNSAFLSVVKGVSGLQPS